MKKIKLLFSTMLIGLNMQSFADVNKIFTNNYGSNVQQVSYSGLNYPQPLNKEENNIMELNSLLSNQILEKGKNAKSKEVSEMRIQALQEIGGALGASGGLVFRMNQIKTELDRYAADLDKLYDFKKLIIDNGVLPPVLTEGLANYAQETSDQVRIADKIYKIEEKAKFVSVYPTWRDYLRFNFPSYEMPNAAYLPKNEAEKAIWDAAVKEGWERGVKQADEIYETSYAKLNRDYKGMIKYKILLAEGLVTPTIIGKQNLGITGGGREMSINDQVFRIMDHSSLNPNKTEWKVEYPVSNNQNGILK
jgi:defect-in-organelle-trafficking protein DotC